VLLALSDRCSAAVSQGGRPDRRSLEITTEWPLVRKCQKSRFSGAQFTGNELVITSKSGKTNETSVSLSSELLAAVGAGGITTDPYAIFAFDGATYLRMGGLSTASRGCSPSWLPERCAEFIASQNVEGRAS
jgi:hypothetical protein